MERRASIFLQKTLATILNIPHNFIGILGRQRNIERNCIEKGSVGNVETQLFEHASRHLQGLERSERPRKRIRLVYEEGEDECHSDEIQESATVSPAFADSSRVARDGRFDQLAISLSAVLNSQIHDAGKAARALEQQERLLQEAEQACRLVEAQVSSFHIAQNSVEDDEEYARIQEAGERFSEAAQNARERRDTIKTNLEDLSRIEKLYKTQLQHFLERTLDKAGLLDVSRLEPDPPQYPDQADDDRNDSTSLLSGGTTSSPSEITRRTAYEALYSAQEAMEKAELDYDNRENIYLTQLDRYEQAYEAGQVDLSRSEFDCHMCNHTRGLTRTLIDAEEQVEEAKISAKALGLDTWDQFDLGPENRSHKDDGYGMSGEAFMVERLDRDRIYRWCDGVIAACPVSFHEIEQWDEPDVDEWGARSVGMSDAASAIDVDEYADKLQSWKKHCAQLREERVSQ
jgi:hypothetical protein